MGRPPFPSNGSDEILQPPPARSSTDPRRQTGGGAGHLRALTPPRPMPAQRPEAESVAPPSAELADKLDELHLLLVATQTDMREQRDDMREQREDMRQQRLISQAQAVQIADLRTSMGALAKRVGMLGSIGALLGASGPQLFEYAIKIFGAP